MMVDDKKNTAYLREDTPDVPGAHRHFQLVGPNGKVIRGMDQTTAKLFGFEV